MHDAVLHAYDDLAAWREAVWDRHAARAGFRLARAYDTGRLVGFADGYTGEHGQRWTDRAAAVLPAEVTEQWLGGHRELVSIAVLVHDRGQGTGRRLLTALTDGLPHDRWLLMASAHADDPARRLYAATGWSVLGPGLGPDQVVMGRRQGQDTSGL